MGDDFIYPNDGANFQQDVQLEREREMEETQLFKELPIIQKTIRSLQKRKRFYETIHAIPDDVMTNPQEYMHITYGNKCAADALENEIAILEQLVKEYVSDER